MSRFPYARTALALVVSLGWMQPDPAGAAEGTPFAALLGGDGEDRPSAIAVDAAGSVFVVGTTDSDGLATAGAVQGSRGGGDDAFLARFAADGRTLLFATYLGGGADDAALAVVPDGSGGAWVAGVTVSTDFPVHAAFQGASAGGTDGFLAHVSASGATLLSSTYLGGSGDDRVTGVALDATGDPWVAGTTGSTDLATTDGTYQPYAMGGTDAFLAHLSADGANLLHGTYFGGTGNDEVSSMVPGPGNTFVLAGRTDSVDLPVVAPSQSLHGGGWDAFVSRIAADAATLAFSTYAGGSGDDGASALASGPSGYACVGITESPDFPYWSGLDAGPSGGTDGFVAAFSTVDDLRFLAPLGGSGDDRALAVALDDGGAVLVAGGTTSADLPLRAAAVTGAIGLEDGFLVRIAQGGTSATYATYLGGTADDAVHAMVASDGGSVLLAGRTASAEFGTGSGAPAGTPAGGTDAFLARVPAAPPAPAHLSVTAVALHAVSLSWEDTSGGRASFELERRSGATGFEPLASPAAGVLSFADGTVAPSSTYAYRVRAVIDGSPSPFGDEVAVVTPGIPVPTVPGAPAAVATSARGILVTWEDRSDQELSFEVFRSVDGGALALLRSLPAGSTSFADDVTPDRTWSYAVRAVGVSGASPLSATVSAATAGTLSVHVVKGRRADGARTGRDAVGLLATVSAAAGASVPDPREGGLQVGLGAAGSAPVLSIAAGTAGWKEHRGVLRWKSPKGFPTRASVTLDRERGTLKVKATGLELPACDAAAVRTSVRCAPEAGSAVDPWEERKPGLLLHAE